ncbi:MAG: hypothetical protein QOH68_356 [Nocardioidaceae bacterium]|jgi:3-phenylpropionate/trans-cinnamate dioxygenase ferredoxin reductase subunit|nr:hypothetical protein [Nocardioidaceae bacterium]
MSHAAGGTIVVVGASVASAAFVSEARHLGHEGVIVVVDSDVDAPYDRPPLSKEFLSAGSEQLDRPGAPWWDARCEFVRAHATSLALDHLRVHLRADDGLEWDLSADHVVIATGASPIALPDEPDGVLSLRTAADARVLRQRLHDRASLAIIGAGAIGTELASSASAAGCEVAVLDRARHPLERLLGGHLGAEAAKWMSDAGINTFLGGNIDKISRLDSGWSVNFGVEEVRADVVVSAVGSRPLIHWLKDSSLQLIDGVRCDADGAALNAAGLPVPGVHAIGDAAAWRTFEGAFRRHEDWTSAQRQGRHVAQRLFGGAPGSIDREPAYFWTHQFGRRIQVLGDPSAGDRLVQHVDVPEKRAAFYTVEQADGETVAWVAVNRPREFALAMRDASKVVG